MRDAAALTRFSCCQRRAPGRGAPGPPGSSAPPASAHPRAGRGWGRPGGTRLPGASWGRLSEERRARGGCEAVSQVDFLLFRAHRWLAATHQGWVRGVASALGPHQVQGLQGGVVVRGHPAVRPAPAPLHWKGRGGEAENAVSAVQPVTQWWFSAGVTHDQTCC